MSPYAPRKATLAESIYETIDEDENLLKISNDLLFNYSVKMFDAPVLEEKIDRQLALRYADLLSKSIHPEKADQHKIWGQEIAILLKILYPNDPMVKYYLGSVLSSAGNYRGLQSKIMEDFEIVDVMDGLYYCYDKSAMEIPGQEESYFFHDQQKVYSELDGKLFSYSGPTSMGKSFVAQTYIIQQIENLLCPEETAAQEYHGQDIHPEEDADRNGHQQLGICQRLPAFLREGCIIHCHQAPSFAPARRTFALRILPIIFENQRFTTGDPITTSRTMTIAL